VRRARDAVEPDAAHRVADDGDAIAVELRDHPGGVAGEGARDGAAVRAFSDERRRAVLLDERAEEGDLGIRHAPDRRRPSEDVTSDEPALTEQEDAAVAHPPEAA